MFLYVHVCICTIEACVCTIVLCNYIIFDIVLCVSLLLYYFYYQFLFSVITFCCNVHLDLYQGYFRELLMLDYEVLLKLSLDTFVYV